jgi:hypothetical protein
MRREGCQSSCKRQLNAQASRKRPALGIGKALRRNGVYRNARLTRTELPVTALPSPLQFMTPRLGLAAVLAMALNCLLQVHLSIANAPLAAIFGRRRHRAEQEKP